MGLRVIENKCKKNEANDNQITYINQFEERTKNIKEIYKNVLYITKNGFNTNFYESIRNCSFCNVIEKNDINKILIEPYDAFIISFSIFVNEKYSYELVDSVIDTGKPVIIIYNSLFSLEHKGFKYLEQKYNIVFEEKDCSIIENGYDNYSIGGTRQKGYAISMKFSKGYGRANIKNTNLYYIFRYKNVSVLHDVSLEFIEPKQSNVKQIDTTLLNLLQVLSGTTRPSWVDDINIFDDLQIKNDIVSLKNEIEKLDIERKHKVEMLDKNNEYKKLLYTSGDDLVHIVKMVLEEMLDVKVNDQDLKREDLSFELNNKKILVEVKGINTSVKRENVSQLRNHIEDDAILNNIEDDEIHNKYKGLLIINPYIKSTIEDKIKKDFYSKAVESDIKHEDFFAIDTISLLSLYCKFKQGKIKNIIKYIFDNNFIGTDFSILGKK